MISEASAFSRKSVALAGGEIALLRFGAAGAAPLLFAHANGFCASAYRQMLAAIGDRFDIFAVDLRGHGRTTLSTDPSGHRSMDVFGEDVSAILDAISIRSGLKWTLAGHSMGAVAVTLAAAGRDDIEQLRLVEPVATPPWWRLLAMSPGWRVFAPRIPLVRAAMGRRAKWPDRAAVHASYSNKPLFSTWAPGVLDDYLEDGLRRAADGVALACAPAWEAANFAGHAHDFWGALRRVKAPVAVLAAARAPTTVPADAVRRFERLGATVAPLEEASHLAPFEDPVSVARFIAAD